MGQPSQIVGTRLLMLQYYLLNYQTWSNLQKAAEHSITIPEVQPKLTIGWFKKQLNEGHRNRLTIMDVLEGQYILKP